MKVDVDFLVEKISKEKKLFEMMTEISLRQVNLLQSTSDDTDIVDEFTGMVEKREELINKIELSGRQRLAIEKELGEDILNDDKYDDYQEQKSIIFNLIKVIQENDVKSNKLAGELLQHTGNKLGNTRNNRKAIKAYLNEDVYTGAWFFDRKK